MKMKKINKYNTHKKKLKNLLNNVLKLKFKNKSKKCKFKKLKNKNKSKKCKFNKINKKKA